MSELESPYEAPKSETFVEETVQGYPAGISDIATQTLVWLRLIVILMVVGFGVVFFGSFTLWRSGGISGLISAMAFLFIGVFILVLPVKKVLECRAALKVLAESPNDQSVHQALVSIQKVFTYVGVLILMSWVLTYAGCF